MRLISLTCFLAFALLFSGLSNAEAEMEQRTAIADMAKKYFLAEKFSELEKMSSIYRSQKSRTSSGGWKLTFFHEGICASVDIRSQGKDPAKFKAFEARAKKWARQYPNSPSAHIAYSQALISLAFTYRGGGVASTVKPESWAPFRRYVAMARENLLKYKSVAAMDPAWYSTMMDVAIYEGWDRKEFYNLLNEALGREPLYYQTYFSAANYLSPQWHGGVEELEAFAQDAVKRTAKQEGKGMYARIYWVASQQHFREGLFDETLARWPEMKEGFEDILARYPDAWNLNNYAVYACAANDKVKAKELLERTESSIIPDAWQQSYHDMTFRNACKRWATDPKFVGDLTVRTWKPQRKQQ